MQNRNTHDEIADNLNANYGIDKHKVISIHTLLDDTKLDKVMSVNKDKLDGVVLGLSHGLTGINPKLLQGKWKNLCNGSEDLYYHYQVLKELVEKYPESVENLSRVIIDMFDYTNFNYDLSRARNICRYWSHGGIYTDVHNFSQNTLYNCSQDEAMKREGFFLPDKSMQFLSKKILNPAVLRKRLSEFYAYLSFDFQGNNDYPLVSQLCNVVPANIEIETGMHFMGYERYKETMEENVFLFEKIITMLRDINKNIQIYIILLPRYYKVEQQHHMLLKDYKEEFEAIISNFRKSYDFYYWDMKDLEGISKNRFLYQDAAHLNYYGGLAFTSVLNDMIKKVSS